MAVSAKFVANFDDFNRAIDKAEVKLRDFGRATQNVDKDLSRVGDSFSGQRIAQEAVLAAKAVDAIGGASKLTESEAKRLAGTVNEAMLKFKALGVEAPKAVSDLHRALQPVPQQLSLVDKAAGSLKSSFGQMFSAFTLGNLAASGVTSLISFGKAAFTAASEIHDMSLQLGISAEATQGFRFAAEQAGSSLDAVGTSLTKMNVNLSKGSAATVDALRSIGLSFSSIRSMKPEDAFLAITDALQKIPDPMEQSAAAVQLFGRSAAELLPAIKEGFRQAADEAPKMADSTVESLQRAQDAWEKLGNKITIVTGSAIASMFAMAEASGESAEQVRARREITGSRATMPDIQLAPSVTGAPSRSMVAELREAEAAVRSLTTAQREELDAALKIGKANEDFLEGLGLTNAALKVYEATTKEATKADKEAAKEKEKMVKFLADETALLRKLSGEAAEKPLFQEQAPKAALEALRLQNEELERRNFLLKEVSGQNSLAVPPLFQEVGPKLAKGMFSGFGDDLKKQLGPAIVQAVQGGGNVVSSIAGTFGADITKRLFGGDAIQKSISGVFGKTIGGALGSVLPGIGALAGPAIEGVTKLFGKIFKSEGKKTNDLRDSMFGGMGGFEEVAKVAARVGVSMDTLLKPNKVKDFEAAWKNLNDAITAQDAILQKYGITWQDFEGPERARRLGAEVATLTADFKALEQAGVSHEAIVKKLGPAYAQMAVAAVEAGEEIPVALAPVLRDMAALGQLTTNQVQALLGMGEAAGPTWQSMEDAAKKYGVELDALGARYKQLKLNDTADELAKDFDLLIEGGADANGVLAGMTDEINEVVQEALKFGLEVPDSMKPMLESMIEHGRLTDEAGNKLTDLSGIKFAAPMVSEIDKLIEKLDELIETLGRVPGALPASLPLPELTGAAEVDVVPMARGGRGMVNKPTLFLAGEAGPEEFAFSGAGKRFGRAGRSSDGMREVAAGLAALQREFRTMPLMIASALQARGV